MGAIIRGKCPTILQQQARVQKLVRNIGKGKTVCIVVTVAIVQGLLMYCVHYRGAWINNAALGFSFLHSLKVYPIDCKDFQEYHAGDILVKCYTTIQYSSLCPC